MPPLNTTKIHPTWLPLVKQALETLDPAYLQELEQSESWLPGHKNIFNAFSMPLPQVHYILFGESPYPRKESANGYAFWDAAVSDLWSEKGLATRLNRATSLRHILKMLLVADGKLTSDDISQATITKIDKSSYVTTLAELFNNLQKRGFLLLNATLVLRKGFVPKDATAWLSFMKKLLALLATQRPDIELILLGKIAQIIGKLPEAKSFKQFHAEHPYNISFPYNKDVLNFFRPLHLLNK